MVRHKSFDVVHQKDMRKYGNIYRHHAIIVDIKCDRRRAMSVYVTDHNSFDIVHQKDI